MACVTNEQIKKAREELDKIQSNKALMDAILAEDLAERDHASAIARAEKLGTEKGMRAGRLEGEKVGIEKGRLEGRLEGKLEGEIEKQKEIAKNLLKINMSIEQIIQVTGLSRDEILEIAKEE